MAIVLAQPEDRATALHRPIVTERGFVRRRETRDALALADQAERHRELTRWMTEADELADDLEVFLAGARFAIAEAALALDTLPHEGHSLQRDIWERHLARHEVEEEALVERIGRTRLTAKRWADVLAGNSLPHHYVPSEHYELDVNPRGEKVHCLVQEDDRLPEFIPIDGDALPDDVRDRLISIVSDARNWAQEPTGVTETDVVHVRRANGEVGVKSIRSKVRRTYPGKYTIGSEQDGFRIGVFTVWLTKRQTWGVYACWDGGRKGRYTEWLPFEWYPVDSIPGEPGSRGPEQGVKPHRNRAVVGASDPECYRLDRALEIAYLKQKALRSEWGAAPLSAEQAIHLPYAPERLAVIQDGQSSGNGRRRRTSEPPE